MTTKAQTAPAKAKPKVLEQMKASGLYLWGYL